MSHTANILALIAELGPQTRAEIGEALGLSKEKTSALLYKLSNPTPTLPKRVHVSDYVYDNEGDRFYPRPVYDLGDKPDKQRTRKVRRSDVLANKRRHFVSASLRVSSVFDLGLSPSRRYQKYSGTWLGQ